MAPVRVRWTRVLGIYVALAAVCLVTGLCTRPPLHDLLLVIGLFFVAGFGPLIMAIYFARGLLGIH